MPILLTTYSSHPLLHPNNSSTRTKEEVQSRLWEETTFIMENLQNLRNFYQQESEEHIWEYIQRMEED